MEAVGAWLMMGTMMAIVTRGYVMGRDRGELCGEGSSLSGRILWIDLRGGRKRPRDDPHVNGPEKEGADRGS